MSTYLLACGVVRVAETVVQGPVSVENQAQSGGVWSRTLPGWRVHAALLGEDTHSQMIFSSC